ncbi:hypothetical protein B0H67DRAFT_645102 [Lasiosphaeris hirsuta]|uniref:Uncharacterized protein n=1 Tax=Lasiosphaeris hirsuta TaxID=260670 RepID=A0AA40AGF9_9PEZI|nr:hypothetical protein B0H67DRAFT_645102 [Lasiosphaeris hirsuta]
MSGQRTCDGAIIAISLVATTLLTILPGLGAFASGSSTSWSTLTNVSPSSWNVGVVIIGTALGPNSHDEFLSRLELASPKGVPVIFLHLLTAKRGLEQFVKGRLALERTALVLLTLATALTPAATVALFSVQTTVEAVTNPYPPFSLTLLNATFFKTVHGGVSALGATVDSRSIIPALSSFLNLSAFINRQIAQLGEHFTTARELQGFVPYEGALGETTYQDLWTSGVGINVKPYLTYQGPTDHFSVPTNYSFNSLRGQVYGTTINVACENRTASYDRREISSFEMQSDFWLTTVTKAGQDANSQPNITVVSRGTNEDSSLTSLAIRSNLTYPSSAAEQERDNLAPLHVILAAGFSQSLGEVFECTYSGREVLAVVGEDNCAKPSNRVMLLLTILPTARVPTKIVAMGQILWAAVQVISRLKWSGCFGESQSVASAASLAGVLVVLIKVEYLPFWFYASIWLEPFRIAVVVLVMIAHAIARLSLIVEMFRALCFLPPDAYVATWAANLPHVG